MFVTYPHHLQMTLDFVKTPVSFQSDFFTQTYAASDMIEY